MNFLNKFARKKKSRTKNEKGFSLIELLVAFLQAYIFTMLSALFIGMAVAEHDHDHAHDEQGHEIPDTEDVRGDFI